MKLTDLIDALAAEIQLAQAQLDQSLQELAERDIDDPVFLDAFDQYSGQAQRMGEAAEMAGFPGLQSVCGHVVENCLLLTVTPAEERAPLVDFLRGWPPLIVHYLQNLSDPSVAEGVIDHLCSAPMPMDEEEARKVMHMLGAMPLQVAGPGADQGQQLRPVLASPEDVTLEMPGDVDARLLDGFAQEAPEQARYLVALARNMAAGEGDSSDVVAARRVAHTLKGSASIIGLRGITSLSHHLEDILDHFEQSAGSVSRQAGDALLDAAYCLEQMVGYVLGTDDYPVQSRTVLQTVLDLANLIDRGESLESLPLRGDTGLGQARGASMAGVSAQLAVPPAASFPATMSADMTLPTTEIATGAEVSEGIAGPTPAPGAVMRVSMQRIDELFRVQGEVSVHTSAMEARIKALVDSSRELLAQNLRVQKRLFELETVVDIRTTGALRGRRQAGAGFDPLEMDQYSELHSTSHALAEEAADARTLAAHLEEDIAQLSSLQARQQRLNKDMQHLVIGTRMTEVSVLESRLHRTVRSTGSATGKEARLTIEGGSTLIDADVLSRLAEPLLHLLRNAVDHGLETPAEREAQGKPLAGHIALAFTRQGQQVVLRCQDDGYGLDLPRIRQRAIDRALVAPDQALTDEETARLILLAGFSTRDAVSEISGRGVGLDVVREWVGQMNGSIRIHSVPGRGCTFELRFAASLSTVQTLVVEAAGQRFGLPSVQVELAVARGIGSFEYVGSQLVYRHGLRMVPAVRLADAAGLQDASDKALADFDAVIVRVDDRSHALAVDRLIDARELLVKSPGRFARHVQGVAGLSILGDGGIAVNLDLGQLLSPGSRRAQSAAHAPVARPKQRELPGVLIVDDALSVRTSLRQLVQDAGYFAETARDGIEAIAALRTFHPRIVLTDLEMPNMNGVELTSHLRGRADMKGMPIVMITSRSQEKHRRMAEQAGVDAYFTKPYNDAELLEAIRSRLTA
jgi:chemotaxis protein histidine kinase CheA/ActR/RegA family two-component response regulator